MTAMDFAGANTGRGYEQFLRELRPRQAGARVCVLRGAPGTARRQLLQRLAREWQRQGRAVCCHAGAEGGDSLLAVVSGDRAALDGALPLGPEAGPEDLAIDLSAALDLSALRGQRAQAEALQRRVQSLRSRAWRCLQVAHTAWSDTAAIYAEAADQGAVMNLRLELSRWMQGESGQRRRVFARAVTPDGVVSHTEGLARPHTLCLELPWGFDPDPLLYPVAAALQLRGEGHTAVMQLLDGGRLEHLCTDTHAVVTEPLPGCEKRTLPLDEAVLRREQSALAFNRAAYDLWLRQGVEALSAARDCALRLERLVEDAALPDKREELAQAALRFLA